MKAVRRLTSQKLGLLEDSGVGDNDIKNLPAIDKSKAERFQDEGITNIPQLAYYDPVKLAMKTNMDYDYIVDCVSQALLFIYVGKDWLQKLSLNGIRGAYEMRGIFLDLDEGGPDEKEQAKQKLRKIAEQIGYPPEGLENVCFEAGAILALTLFTKRGGRLAIKARRDSGINLRFCPSRDEVRDVDNL